MLLLRIILRTKAIASRIRLGVHHIVDGPAKCEQLVDVVALAQLVDMTPMVAAEHSAFVYRHSGGIGDDRLIDAHLGAVGEAGDHPWVLPPAPRKPLLCSGIAVRIVKSLDVAADQWSDPDASYEADQVHLLASLIAVASGEHHTCGVGQPAQLGADGGVEFGIHQHQMLASGEAVQREMTAELD